MERTGSAIAILRITLENRRIDRDTKLLCRVRGVLIDGQGNFLWTMNAVQSRTILTGLFRCDLSRGLDERPWWRLALLPRMAAGPGQSRFPNDADILVGPRSAMRHATGKQDCFEDSAATADVDPA